MAKKKHYQKKYKKVKKDSEIKSEKKSDGAVIEETSGLKFTFDDVILVLVIIWAVCMVYFRQ